MTGLRVLFACPFPPARDATAGGPKETAALMVALSQLCEVRALCLRADPEEGAGRELREVGVDVEEIARGAVNRSTTERLARWPLVVGGWTMGHPRAVTALVSRAFAHRLAEIVAGWRPDVVHFEHIHMAWCSDAVRRPAVRAIRALEPAAATAHELAVLRHGPSRLPAVVDAAVWRRFERRVVSSADALVVLTGADRGRIYGVSGSMAVLESGLTVAVPEHSNDPHLADDRTVAFVANFAHQPNVQAANDLVRGVLPALRAEIADAELLLVGEGSSGVARDADAVAATGRVDDVAHELERAAVVAAPIRTGGGMRVKVLEALALGKPLVATARAVAGLRVVDGTHVLVAETDEEFARAIASLLADRPRRLVLGAAARAWAVAEAARSPASELHAFYEQLVTERRQDSA